MSDNDQAPDPTTEELDAFRENQRKVPPEDLLPYAGKHVAWSVDSARIVASGDDYGEVSDKVVAAGIAPNRVVFGFIDEPDMPCLGAGFDFIDASIQFPPYEPL